MKKERRTVEAAVLIGPADGRTSRTKHEDRPGSGPTGSPAFHDGPEGKSTDLLCQSGTR